MSQLLWAGGFKMRTVSADQWYNINPTYLLFTVSWVRVGDLRGWLYRNGFSTGTTRHGVVPGDVIFYDYHSDGVGITAQWLTTGLRHLRC